MTDIGRLKRIVESYEDKQRLARKLLDKYHVEQGDYGVEYSDRDPIGSILSFLESSYDVQRDLILKNTQTLERSESNLRMMTRAADTEKDNAAGWRQIALDVRKKLEIAQLQLKTLLAADDDVVSIDLKAWAQQLIEKLKETSP